MDQFWNIIRVVDIQLIQTLFPMILIIIFIDRIFKGKSQINRSLKVINWLIIGYTIVNLSGYVIQELINPTPPNEVSNDQNNIFLFLRICALVVPFSLLIKRLATKPFVVLVVAFIMNLGWRLEVYTIVLTTYLRDYPNIHAQSHSVLLPFLFRILQGMVFGVMLLGILELLYRKEDEPTNIIDSEMKN